MANGQQYDFSQIAKPIPPGMKIGIHADTDTSAPSTPGALDFSKIATPLTDNPNKEGLYSMSTSEGDSSHIPFSKVLSAGRAGYKLDPKDYSRFTQDFHAKYSKKGSQASSESPESVFGSASAAENAKRKGFDYAHAAVDMLPTAGAVAGGMLVGIPGIATGPADLAIASAGAGAGAGLGEIARQAIDDWVWGETMTPGQSVKSVGVQAALGAATEVGGRLASVPLAKGAQWFGDTASKAAAAGFKLLPHEARGAAANFAERYAKESLFSSALMSKWREAQNRETLAAAEKLANSLSNFKGTNQQFGQLMQKGIESYRTAFRTVQNAVYKQIDQKVAQAGVSPERKELVDFAKQQLAKIAEAKKAGGASVVSARFENLFRDIIDNPASKATYQGMADARSAWLDMSRSMTEQLSGPEKGLVKKLGELADKSMMDAARTSGIPGLVNNVRAANELTRTTHELFEQKLITKIAKTKEPSIIARELMVPSTSPEGAASLMKMLPANFRPIVQSHLLNEAITTSTKEGNVAFDERGFAKKILALGNEKGLAIFGGHWQRISDIAKVMSNISGDTTGRAGAASLSNPALLKESVIRMSEAAMNFAGGGAAFGSGNLGKFAVGITAEGAVINAFAWTLRHPKASAFMLNVLRRVAQKGPYIGMAGVDALIADTEREEREKAKRNTTTGGDAQPPAEAAPTPEEPAPAPAPEAIPLASAKAEAAQRKPSPSTPSRQYAQYARNADGHRIGTNDGVTWFDVQTGQQIGQ
jgi:hypothetical protein